MERKRRGGEEVDKLEKDQRGEEVGGGRRMRPEE